MNLREQFDAQCSRAQLISGMQQRTLDVVMTRGHGVTKISVIGGAISRAAYDLWPMKGIRIRVLRVYVNGKAQQ